MDTKPNHRPPKPPTHRRRQRVIAYLTPEEVTRVKLAAGPDGISHFVREAIEDAIRRSAVQMHACASRSNAPMHACASAETD